MKKSSDKKDRLERFVRDNRDGFDVFLPQDSLWDRIENRIPSAPAEPQKVKRLNNPYFDWRIAAGVILALGVGYLFYLNNEYGREFNQYNVMIDQKRNEILKLASNNPKLYKDFSADLKSLENSYQNLKSDLGNAPNQEALIHAMIENLQYQVDLLNQQLTILQRIKKAAQSHEKYNSPTT
jgi:hypothetical protein